MIPVFPQKHSFCGGIKTGQAKDRTNATLSYLLDTAELDVTDFLLPMFSIINISMFCEKRALLHLCDTIYQSNNPSGLNASLWFNIPIK